MPYRKVKFQSGQIYHLYNRGVNHQPIFFCQQNWGYLIQQLRRYFHWCRQHGKYVQRRHV